MPQLVNKLSEVLLRLILAMSLMVPLAPAMAGMTDTDSNATVHQQCKNHVQAKSVAPNHQPRVHNAGLNDTEACDESCCSDGKCVCKTTCLNFSTSNTSTYIYSDKVVISQSGNRASLSSNPGASLHSIYFSPALRPPIC